jgi:hypothetical protein
MAAVFVGASTYGETHRCTVVQQHAGSDAAHRRRLAAWLMFTPTSGIEPRRSRGGTITQDALPSRLPESESSGSRPPTVQLDVPGPEPAEGTAKAFRTGSDRPCATRVIVERASAGRLRSTRPVNLKSERADLVAHRAHAGHVVLPSEAPLRLTGLVVSTALIVRRQPTRPSAS